MAERAEHTPGPWEAHNDDGTGTLPCVLSDKVNPSGGFYVAQCNSFEDARLIAAAPGLLAALKEASEHLEYCGYGDSWEREAAVDSGLPEKIAAAIEAAEA